MWASCINQLLPFKNALRVEIPKFLRKAFNDKGILNDEEMFIPIFPVSLLGQCSTAAYVDCPNIPAHHIENAQDFGDNSTRYLNNVGRYYWFDFDITKLDATLLQLRMVFNEGDADCNDGLWGAVWERNTEELIANIMSTGDCETTIEASLRKYIDICESQDIWIPTSFNDDPLSWSSVEYANDLRLEKIIALAIRLCSVYRSSTCYNKYA